MAEDYFFQKNKKSLLEVTQQLSWFINDPFLKPFECEKAKNGEFTCLVNDRWLHSRYDPSSEAQKFIALNGIQEGDFVVLYGIGLGYMLRPILDQIGEKGFLYLVELNPRLLKTAFTYLDLTRELTDFRFKLICGQTQNEIAAQFQEHIFWNLEQIPDNKKKVLIHDTSFALLPDGFEWIRNALEVIQFDRRGDNAFQEEIKENLEANLDTLLHSPGIRELPQIFQNRPIIFVGAGPTLDGCISNLKKYQNHAFIVCVDTAVIPLLHQGIRPDFAVSVDPQQKSFDCFNGFEYEPIPIIVFPTSAKHVVLNTSGQKIFGIQKGSKTSKLLEHRLDFLGLTLGGSAVSVIGVDIVLQSTNGPVIFMGMDFSFPGLKSYANFSPEFNHWHKKAGPYYTLEMASTENIYSRKTVMLESFLGTPVPTFQSMYSYVKSLETIIAAHPRENIFVLNPEGVKIKGVTALLFEEELKQLIPQPIHKKCSFAKVTFDPLLGDFCRKKFSELQ